MKKLTKIQLINWHLFSCQTIDIKSNTLISGENGAGKSTLLDALQYILIGGKFGTKFNIAANENAKRSLENYIKGKIGAENKEFLRNKDVVTHVALEFYDEKMKEYTILGCVLELPYKGILKEKFYLCSKTRLEKDIFLSEMKPKTVKEFLNFFQKRDYNFNFFDSKKEYQKALGKYLQINIQKYIQILPKALAFKPLNLQNFVFEFLLEANPINISSLKNSVQQLKKIENQIELEKKKIEQLKEILEYNKKIKLLKNQKKINFFVQKIALISNYKDNLKKFINSQNFLKIELKNLLSKKQEKDDDIEKINEKILNLQNVEIKNYSGILFHSLKKDLAKKEKNIKKYEDQILLFEEKLELELKNLESVYSLNNDFFLKQKIQIINLFLNNKQEEKNNFLLSKDIIEINDYLSQLKKTVYIKINDLNQKITYLKKSISEKQYNLEMINNFIPHYHPNLIKLLNLLKEQLKNIYQNEISIHPLCELIEIKDELWRNVIEGFLGIRKFNLIIDSRFFDQSLEIYEKFQSIEKIYDIGLVNVDKIPFITDNEKSLAFQIKTENKYALKYVKLLLSHIICELDVNNLKKHQTAITPQGMIYSNYTAKQLNPKSYNIPFIGINAKKIRQKILLKEIDLLKKELIFQKENFVFNEKLIFFIEKSNFFSFSVDEYLLYRKKIVENLKEKEKIKLKIEDCKNNFNLSDLDNNLKKIQEEKKVQIEEINNIIFTLAEKKNQLKILEQKIISIEKELTKIQEELKQYENDEINNIEAANVQFQNFVIKYKNQYEKIFLISKENLIQIEKQINKQKIEIITKMNLYIEQYNLINIEAKIENIEYFSNEYNFISFKNLINYEQEAKELSFKIEIIFKEEFVNKLKESLENAKQQIQKLNEILKNRPFGNDYYQIITKSPDNPEYKKYSYIFSEKSNNVSEINLFSENLSSYKEILLDELFKKIISFNNEYESFVYEFLDYRNYLSYDIQINDQNGNISLFSKVFREKSGGETQVPFYIIISICFEQLLFNENSEKGCLVLFDEAFNNMDENRIDAMMSFLNELKIQFIIAVPPQRIINILPYVKTNLIIIKENDYAIVENFSRET